jgi:hypothetical protein
VNERTADVAVDFEAHGSGILAADVTYTFICECATIGCTKPLTLTLATYAEARATPEAFLVAAGHESRDHERVIASVDDCVIVVPTAPTPTGTAHR